MPTKEQTAETMKFIRTFISDDYEQKDTAYEKRLAVDGGSGKMFLWDLANYEEDEDAKEADAGTKAGTEASRMFMDAFTNYIGTISAGSSQEDMDIFESSESIQKFGQQHMSNLMTATGVQEDVDIFAGGFFGASNAALKQYSEDIFSSVQSRKTGISGKLAAPGLRNQTVLDGRQNVIG